MPKKSPIIIIEDDDEDRNIFQEAFTELGFKNHLVFFNSANEALTYLEETDEKAFLIICDMNLPEMSGMDLKKAINANDDLKKKAVPFIFYTASADNYTINTAFFDTMVQGYFVKEDSVAKIKSSVKAIIDYWSLSRHPNST